MDELTVIAVNDPAVRLTSMIVGLLNDHPCGETAPKCLKAHC